VDITTRGNQRLRPRGRVDADNSPRPIASSLFRDEKVAIAGNDDTARVLKITSRRDDLLCSRSWVNADKSPRGARPGGVDIGDEDVAVGCKGKPIRMIKKAPRGNSGLRAGSGIDSNDSSRTAARPRIAE